MVDALDQHDAVWAKLDTIDGLATYDGEVPANPPVDTDGRSAAYAVLYTSPGDLYSTSLDGAQATLLGSFQVTCAGGDPTRALWAVRKVREGILGPLTVTGRTFHVRAREGADPGTVRRDDDVRPPRHYVPLEFLLLTT